MATLLLTRPAPQSDRFADQCRALGFSGPVIVSPLIEIVFRALTLDPDRYPTLVFTSANAVAAVADRLPAGRVAYAVGDATARAVRDVGLPCRSAAGDAEALFARLTDDSPPAPLLHLRGAHSRGDLAERLSDAGLPTDEAVVYDQIARPLSGAARAALASGNPLILPLFSPRTAALAGAEIPAVTGPRRVLALSAAVRAAWPHGDAVEVAARPEAAALAELVAGGAFG
jgi:uroporphyrinogen-III synthase